MCTVNIRRRRAATMRSPTPAREKSEAIRGLPTVVSRPSSLERAVRAHAPHLPPSLRMTPTRPSRLPHRDLNTSAPTRWHAAASLSPNSETFRRTSLGATEACSGRATRSAHQMAAPRAVDGPKGRGNTDRATPRPSRTQWITSDHTSARDPRGDTCAVVADAIATLASSERAKAACAMKDVADAQVAHANVVLLARSRVDRARTAREARTTASEI